MVQMPSDKRSTRGAIECVHKHSSCYRRQFCSPDIVSCGRDPHSCALSQLVYCREEAASDWTTSRSAQRDVGMQMQKVRHRRECLGC